MTGNALQAAKSVTTGMNLSGRKFTGSYKYLSGSVVALDLKAKPATATIKACVDDAVVLRDKTGKALTSPSGKGLYERQTGARWREVEGRGDGDLACQRRRLCVMRLLGSAASGLLVLAGLAVATPAQSSASSSDTCTGMATSLLDTAQAQLQCPRRQSSDEKTPPPKRRTGSSSVKPACVWVPEPAYQPGTGQKAEGAGGQWYRKFCSFGEYQTLADFEREMGTWDAMNMRQSTMMRRAGLDTQWFATPPPAPIPTPQQVIASIVDRLRYPKPYIAVNPVATQLVVGVPTWVWLTDDEGRTAAEQYRPKPRIIDEYGHQLKWQVVPAIALSPGDGGLDQVCAGAGVPWSAAAESDPDSCKVTYEKSGRYTLTASGVGLCNGGWTVRGKRMSRAEDSSTATQPVTVVEIQTLGR